MGGLGQSKQWPRFLMETQSSMRAGPLQGHPGLPMAGRGPDRHGQEEGIDSRVVPAACCWAVHIRYIWVLVDAAHWSCSPGCNRVELEQGSRLSQVPKPCEPPSSLPFPLCTYGCCCPLV